MLKNRLKLFLFIIIGGLFVIGGYILAGKYRPEEKILTLNLTTQDSDSDGLIDTKEKELNTNPYQKDSDNDGFDDKTEINTGHDPNKAESDQLIDKDNDGLIGADEDKYGTDPNNPDTDFDGYKDGEEIAAGHDPKTADLSNLKTLISQIPEDKKQEAKQITGMDLISESAINNLQETLSSDQKEKVQGLLDQIVSTPQSGNLLKEISDSEIKILNQEVNQDSAQKYFDDLITAYYTKLDFLFNQKKLEEATDNDGYASIISNITQQVSQTLISIKNISVPNNQDFINLHKKSIAILSAYISNYDLIMNNDDSAQAINKKTQGLKNVLDLNSLFLDAHLKEITDLASQNNIDKFTIIK